MTQPLNTLASAFRHPQMACYTSGLFQVHHYLVWQAEQAVLFDAGADVSEALALVAERQLTLTHLLLTHAHLDHVQGWEAVLEAHPSCQIYAHAESDFWLDRLSEQAMRFGMTAPKRPVVHQQLTHQETLQLGKLEVTVLHAPGHAPESLCYYLPALKSVIVGDVLFYRSIGRTDFPRGDHETLLASIRNQLFTLPPDTHVHSGHGPVTTVQDEKAHNPFLLA